MAFKLAVYASQPRLPSHHARLAFGCRSDLADRDLNPLGLIVRFPFRCFSSLHPFLLT